MGVKGLQSFLECCCPEACVTVNLRDMARQHSATSQREPTLVVDGLACLRHWYSCKDWVCGGQWREYMDVLKNWVEAFTSAGIRLVFFFDGVVEEQKREEWVKRRRRVNGDVSRMFRYIKAHGEQPGRELFCLPSGLSTFTCCALSSLGQEVFCSLREADYEIASYARQHSSMGILGQDTDFIIYDSAPYLSVAKLQISSMSTVLYDRQRLCQTIGLTVSQLPLLACLLGNDVVSMEKMQHIRKNAMEAYRKVGLASYSGAPQGQMVLAVAQLVKSLWRKEEMEAGNIPQSLNLSDPLRELIKKGMCYYLLPGKDSLQQDDLSACSSASAFEKYVSPQILKVCREKHVAGEGFMAYGVLCEGVIECSNTLEDEEDTELMPQALVYKPCRQKVYGVLLLLGHDGSTDDLPAIKEWFVYPGSPLKEPDMVHPVPISLPCDRPSLDLLWFGTGPEVSDLRLTSFLSILDCQEFSELKGAVEDSLLAALCLVTYIVLQVQTVSQEDVDAYLSQAVCLRLKSPRELQQVKLPFLSSRAVQLGSLYVRGLAHLLGANSASGCPLPSAALMPWHSFDGRLFHSKYLLAHGGTETSVLLDGDVSGDSTTKRGICVVAICLRKVRSRMFNMLRLFILQTSCLSMFLHLREKLIETCRKRGRILQSRPNAPSQSPTSAPGHRHTGGGEGWRRGGGAARGGGWRQRGDRHEHGNPGRQWGGGGQHFRPRHSSSYPEEGPENTSCSSKQSRGRSRGRYQLAPRWSQPPAPGAEEQRNKRNDPRK